VENPEIHSLGSACDRLQMDKLKVVDATRSAEINCRGA